MRGHAFHHAWAARSALELVSPLSDLELLTVEGFSEEDEPFLSDKAIEVADLVRYRGGRSAQTAHRIEVIQFKHSDASALDHFRAADAAKTVRKFAKTFLDYEGEIGAPRRDEVVRFELATNRPIHPDLLSAVDNLAQGRREAGDVGKQMEALFTAADLKPAAAPAFFERLSFAGGGGTLRASRAALRRIIAGWGPPSEYQARLRFQELLELVREAASGKGVLRNALTVVEVLGALGVEQEGDLFPAEAAFPGVTHRLARRAVDDVLACLVSEPTPLIVHATGGMGKTVLMQGVAERLSAEGLAILFDGFGGGSWRDPADSRHRPLRGLLQLVNEIAAKGLCEPLLPTDGEGSDLVRTARRRFEAAVEALRAQGLSGGISLILDAVDHSADRARQTGEESFAAQLLETLTYSPIAGVRLVLSCRTERLLLTKGSVECRDLPIPPFSDIETRALIKVRLPSATAGDTAALLTRARGNPRILDALLAQGRPFEAEAGPPQSLAAALDGLLAKQLEAATANAKRAGASRTEIDALLAGLALLPPPVPPEELAAAQGMSVALVESFVADMFPVIEQTSHGMIFRDEPTETYIRGLFEFDPNAQAGVLARLDQRQSVSSYAARAYPVVLRNLGRHPELYALALDDRFPTTASGDVAQRAIRLARLDAALQSAAEQGDRDRLLTLTLEAGRLAGGHGRSDRFLREHPDLVAFSGDAEARRRVFEDRGTWGGARHASRALAAYFNGDRTEAQREARRSLDWLNWYIDQQRRSTESRNDLPTLEASDIDGPAMIMIRTGRASSMLTWVLAGDTGTAYAHLSNVVELLERAAGVFPEDAEWRLRAYRILARRRSSPGLALMAVLAHAPSVPSDLADELAVALLTADLPDFKVRPHADDDWLGLKSVLVRTAAWELMRGRPDAARTLLDRADLRRPRQYAFEPPVTGYASFQVWLLAVLVRAACDGRPVDLRDVAPQDIDALVERPKDRASLETYQAALKAALAEPEQTPTGPKASQALEARRDSRRRMTDFLTHRLPVLAHMLETLRPLVHAGNVSEAVAWSARYCRTELQAVSTYPFPDQRQFVGSTLVGLAEMLARAAMGIERTAAKAIADALVHSAVHYLPREIDWVRLLALRPDTVPVAVELASRISKVVAEDESVDTRIAKFAALAYAFWGASAKEARSYFQIALQSADALSADDFEETQGLIGLAGNYGGDPLPAEVVNGFARICEAQMPYEADRYSWREFSEAVARIGGLDGLALSGRLEDRDRGGLEYNYLSLTAALVTQRKLAPELAVALSGLREYRDFYVFRFTDFLEQVAPALSPPLREKAFAYAAVEWDRQSLAGVSSELARKFLDLGRKWLPANHTLVKRFEALDALSKASVTTDNALWAPGGSGDPDMEAIVQSIDATSSETLDASLIAALRPGVDQRVSGILRRLGQRLHTPDAQIAFLEAVADAKVPPLAEKLWGITDHFNAWAGVSRAVRDARRRIVETLIVRHVEALMQGRWDSGYEFTRLLALAGDSLHEADAVVLLLRRVRPSEFRNRSAWLDLAVRLSHLATGSAIGEGLSRYVRLAEATLRPDAYGGVWSEDLRAETDEAEAVAGCLWRALGAVREENRWRAAHAVLRAVELGRTDVLTALFKHINSSSAGPHQAAEVPFRHLHAKLWLLLAVDRIAVVSPSLLEPFRAVLSTIATDPALPHVLMRELAARTLRRLIGSGGRLPGDPDLDAVNASPFPKRDVSNYLGDSYYHPAPEGYVKPLPEFHFDYDFEKHEVMSVARIFGLHKYETGDVIVPWVRHWAPGAENMWGEESGDWSSDHAPVTDTWVGHLAWHGLHLAVGQLLNQKPVVSSEWNPDPARSWINAELLPRDDGYWLADDTGLTPPDNFRALRHHEHLPQISALPAIGGFHTPRPDRVVVDGSWETGDNVEIWIRSAFVATGEARAAAMALALSYGHDVWLPLESDIEDGYGRDPGPFRPWLTAADRIRESGLDLKDPYASHAARRGVEPIALVQTLMNLQPETPFNRVWRDQAGKVAFASETWGGRRGRGRHETERSGRRTVVRTDLIREVCRAWDSTLVVLTFSRIYLKDRPDGDAFPARWLVTLISADGRPRSMVRIPRKVRDAVRSMDRESRREFENIFAAVKAAGAAD